MMCKQTGCTKFIVSLFVSASVHSHDFSLQNPLLSGLKEIAATVLLRKTGEEIDFSTHALKPLQLWQFLQSYQLDPALKHNNKGT